MPYVLTHCTGTIRLRRIYAFGLRRLSHPSRFSLRGVHYNETAVAFCTARFYALRISVVMFLKLTALVSFFLASSAVAAGVSDVTVRYLRSAPLSINGLELAVFSIKELKVINEDAE